MRDENMPLRIGMISTGDEVLQGSIVDTNAAWLANLLTEQGMAMVWRATVADNLEQLVQVFKDASRWCDVVVVNGGLGPTSDDLSAESAAALLQEPLQLSEQWKAVLETRYANRFRGLSASNLKQAMLPASAAIIDNPIGSACGFEISYSDTRFWFTPGVPSEFKRMVSDELLGRLRSLSGKENSLALCRWHTFGLREAELNEMLAGITLPEGMRFGFRAAMPDLEVKLFYPAGHPQFSEIANRLEVLLGDYIFSRDGDGFAAHLHQLMLQKQRSLATAESCTGGLIASQLIAVAGSSAWFERGYVTYSNQAKQDELMVSSEIIEQFGAVSVQVASHMANGARKAAGTDYALSASGIAGPGGGTEEKPVGTVAIALATAEACSVQLVKLPDRGRNYIREASTAIALDMLRRELEDRPVFGDYSLKRITSDVFASDK